jgi:hypothetical protein
MFRNAVFLLVVLCLVASRSDAYGTKGHAMVGAIADQRLATKAILAKIADLLDGLKLEDAALLPDQIKKWDGMDDLSVNPDTFHLPEHPLIEKELLAFWKANPRTDKTKLRPSHHTFHFTDVPVGKDTTYLGGKTGRNQFDIVHMIPYCAKVLQGKEPQNNDRKITKRMAVILLAHYLGDIHQPLHVGAQYFNSQGEPVNPDVNGQGPVFADQGGNKLQLVLQRSSDHGHPTASYNFHTYWDDETVVTAFGIIRKEMRAKRAGAGGKISEPDIARYLATQEPAQWKLQANGIDKLAIAWADEIMPIARQAHERLQFSNIKVDKKHLLASGQALEQPQQGEPSYHDWAGNAVRDELHKAGWRLAALLEEVVQ